MFLGRRHLLIFEERSAKPAFEASRKVRVSVEPLHNIFLLTSAVVYLDYDYFKPTGRAFLTLVSSDYLQKSLKALQNLSISGIPIYSEYYDSPVKPGNSLSHSTHKDRVAAARRGDLLGRGPSAGIPQTEAQEILTVAGLPARTTVEELANVLKDFDIKKTPEGVPQIVKIPL
jgi:hypothetical protein